MKKLLLLLWITISISFSTTGCQNQTPQEGLRQLTFNEGDQYFADWRPDGKAIVYEASNTAGLTSIWTVQPDGSKPRPLFQKDNAFVGAPEYNNDGSKIAYASIIGNNWTIWTMNSDGSDETQVNSPPDQLYDFPVWSPDGLKIACSGRSTGTGDQAELLVMNSDGSEVIELSTFSFVGMNVCSWNPDGTSLVSESGGHLWKVSIDGSGKTQLTDSEGSIDFYPDWSQDGSKIVFCSQQSDGNGNNNTSIDVINADGSNRRTVINNLSHEGWDSVGDPRWSPDGKMIVFTVKIGDHYELWITDFTD